MSTQPQSQGYGQFSFRHAAQITPSANDMTLWNGKWPIAFFVPDASADSVTAQPVGSASSVALPVVNGWNFFEIRKITASTIATVSDANVWVAYA